MAAVGSFVAGCVGTVFVAAFGSMLAALAQEFNSPDYFSLMVLELVMAVILAHGSIVKAVAMVLIGLLLGLVGTDVNSGLTRYTFGISAIWDGIDFVPLVIGMFGIVEIIRNLGQGDVQRRPISAWLRSLWPRMSELRGAWQSALRGIGLGSILGILPGSGAVLAAFASYSLEKKIATDPSRFGRGAIEDVAGPKTANNAAAQTTFITLLTLGLPSNAVMALMMGAMMIQGIAPGSALMEKRPDLFWGMVASMWIGNAMLLVINLPLIGLWVKLLSVPYRILFPAILLFCVIGVYGSNTDPANMVLTAVFALFGYVLLKFGCEPAPLVLVRLHPRAGDGNEPAALAGAVVRRPDDLPRTADLGDAAGHVTDCDRADHFAAAPPIPGAGISVMIEHGRRRHGHGRFGRTSNMTPTSQATRREVSQLLALAAAGLPLPQGAAAQQYPMRYQVRVRIPARQRR